MWMLSIIVFIILKLKSVSSKLKCACRKPKPGLILQAKEDFDLKTSKCYMIGDGLTDIKAGQAAGCKSILIGELNVIYAG